MLVGDVMIFSDFLRAPYRSDKGCIYEKSHEYFFSVTALNMDNEYIITKLWTTQCFAVFIELRYPNLVSIKIFSKQYKMTHSLFPLEVI